jgi:hypothetical protein
MTTPKVSTSRRSFIQTAGAALSVPLAAAGASASVRPAVGDDPLKARLAYLEDLDAIRALNQEYARHVNAGDHEAAAALFTSPPDAQGAPDVRAMAPEGFGEQDVIDVAPDRQTATASLHCTVNIENAIGPDCPLVDMARQQGGGVVRRTERGVFEQVFVRRDGTWKIQRSSFKSLYTLSPGG